MLQVTVGAVLLLGFSVYEGYALQCWACSSDIDRSCADMFNTSDILRFGGGYYQSTYQAGNNQQAYDPYNQRPYDNRDYSTYRSENSGTTESNRDYTRNPTDSRDPNNRGSNFRDDFARRPDDRDRSRDPYSRDSNSRQYDRDPNHPDYQNNRTYGRDFDNRDYNSRGYNSSNRDGYNRYNNTDYRDYYRDGHFRNDTNSTRDYYNDRDRYNQYSRDRDYQNRDYNNRDRNDRESTTRDPNRDRYYDNRDRDYNNRDPNNRNPNYREPINRDPNSRDFDRDRDYRTRDDNSRDPNYRDPYSDRDRSRDQYNRDFNNRDPNYRDGNRDPYFDRDHRDPYNRDPNNRDYPSRDYNRDYNQQGRSYDPNNPPRDYQRAQAQLASSQSGPRLVTCNEEDARLRRMRNVCVKKVQRIGEYQLTYIRRCEAIPLEKEVGTCYDAVARGISLDFCEYCEYDGCNSATGLKFNVFLASLVPLILIWTFLL